MKNKNRVIIVEDDKDINALITYNLCKEGYFVDQIFDGQQASGKLKNEKFDIAILDIMLPQKDGFELCREIKSNEFSLRTFVIMISAKFNQQDKLYAHILGADCYITKPFSISTLVNTVNEINEIQNKEFVVKTPG